MTEVLKILIEANIKLNFKKSVFEVEVKYLGFILSSKGYQADKEKTEALYNAPKPRDEKTLKSFLGLASYYKSL